MMVLLATSSLKLNWVSILISTVVQRKQGKRFLVGEDLGTLLCPLLQTFNFHNQGKNDINKNDHIMLRMPGEMELAPHFQCKCRQLSVKIYKLGPQARVLNLISLSELNHV